MKKEPIEKETANKHFEVDVRSIIPLERAGGNIRQDYGDIKELKDSIKANGIIVPLRAYRNKEVEGGWIAIDGHRRLKAAMELVAEGEVVRAKVITVDSRGLSDEQLIFDMVNTNAGKPLTPKEMAEAVRRLIALGWKEKEIAARFGKNVNFVKNLALFANCPKRVRDMVDENKISYSLVCDLFRRCADFNLVVESIEAAYGVAKETKADQLKRKNLRENKSIEDENEFTAGADKTAKITKKIIDKVSNKVDSMKELQSVFKKQIDKPQDVTNPALYKVLKNIVENKYTAKDIEKLLFVF